MIKLFMPFIVLTIVLTGCKKGAEWYDPTVATSGAGSVSTG